jgi:hypothetical protein
MTRAQLAQDLVVWVAVLRVDETLEVELVD